MKAEELMIGDWFNFLIDIEGGDTEYDPVNEIYQPMQIVSITAWGGNDGEVESTEGVVNDIDQLQFIPLTTEIIEKNFVKFGTQRYIVYGGNSYITDMTNFFELHINFVDFKLEQQIFYVHQLQHVLRLCGIEKEIKL